jgi:regulator of protease activity HflC (stomatin/prohibitin superfamily)
MMDMKIIIKNDERGLLFKDGNYIRCLKPGKYTFNPFIKYSVVVADVNKAFDGAGKNMNLYINDEELLKELSVVDVQDFEIAIHLEDGKLAGVLKPGKYAFWNILKNHDFIMVDTRNPEVTEDIDTSIYNSLKLASFLNNYEVANHEKGILYFNNVVQKVLEPGRYYFWKGPVNINVKNMDLRQQQLDMTGQEIMT